MTTQHGTARTAHGRPTSRRGPRTRRYVTAAVVFLLALFAAASWALTGVVAAWQAPEDFARTVPPGAVILRIGSTGTRWLYYEHPDGAPVASLDELGVSITGPSGREVTAVPTDFAAEYDATGGNLGTAIATFDASAPGEYTVRATATPADGDVLAVGPSLTRPMRTPLVGATVVLAVGVACSVAVLATGRRRT